VRRTKILATVGPASRSSDRLSTLLEAGVDAFRLNLSHGASDDHRADLRTIHAAVRRSGRDVPIVADVPGPKIRIGELSTPPLKLVAGQRWTLDATPEPGDRERVGVELPSFSQAAKPGDPVLVGDGTVALQVVRVGPRAIETKVVAGGEVSSRAGLYLPHAHLRVSVFGPEDRARAKVALEEGVDFLALSFVRDRTDLLGARQWLDRSRAGRSVGLIAKIERAEAVREIDGILAATDGVMVARGDLGIELPLERLALEQKLLVRRANEAGRFVIVATQMLLSMLTSPRPTRAEATDVANAVLDGADAVMLSEESAVGRYPVEAVRWLARIAETTEPAFDPHRLRGAVSEHPRPGESDRSVAAAAVQLAEAVGSRAIVTPTHSGRTARLVAALHPGCPVVAFSSSETVRRQLGLVGGVTSAPTPPHSDLARFHRDAARQVRELKLPGTGPLVLTAGYPVEGRPTNLVTLVDVPTRRRGAAPGRRP
jgi:pyruvate kinase